MEISISLAEEFMLCKILADVAFIYFILKKKFGRVHSKDENCYQRFTISHCSGLQSSGLIKLLNISSRTSISIEYRINKITILCLRASFYGMKNDENILL